MTRPDDSATFRDILTLLRAQAAVRAGAPAIEAADGSAVSYEALLGRVTAVAAGVAGAGLCGSDRRPRTGLVLPNGPDMAVTLLGVAVAGAALPFNPAYTEAEFEAYYRDTRIDALLVHASDQGPAVAAAERLGLRILRLSPEGAVEGVTPLSGELPLPDPDDVALVLLTSGSTGRAKAVPLTHRNVCTSAGDVCRSMDLSPSDRCLTMWEQYHVGGLVDLLLAPLASGGTIICTAGFDVDLFFRLLQSARPTWYQAVPTALNALVFQAGRHPVATRPNTLRLIRSVAAALPARLMAEVAELFDVPVIQTFGMTEAGPLITSTRLPPAVRKPGSVGRSCGAEIRIVGPEGEALPPGEHGEVAVRGPNVFPGYENDPAANAQQFRGGWFHTGDIGYLDADGGLFLTGRIKQLINRGGEKVNPQEVDDALLAHPAVAEAATFPVRHRTLGEDVAAAVVLRGPADPAEIRAFVAERLAGFKVPQRITVLEALPRNAVGKIDRLALSEAAEKQAAQAATQVSEATNGFAARVAAVWAAELNLPKVGLDANFFALGGDSLAAVRVFLAVEAEFGRPLPEKALTGITTVRDMVRLIGESDTETPATVEARGEGGLTLTERRSLTSVMAMGSIPVVRPGSAMKVLNPAGRRTPLFWCFNGPAKEMGALAPVIDPEQPLYGLYSGGRLFPNSEPMFDNLARHYADEILALDPTGPCIVGGNCKGGWIAVRIARMLVAAGKPVLGLCLLEHSDPSLGDFEGRLLFLFGKQSRLRAYRAIGWDRPGWAERFRRPPEAAWVEGGHAEFFRPDHVAGLARIIERFVAGEPLEQNAEARREAERVMAIHRRPILFGLYRSAHRLRDLLVHGRRVRVNPFTGEPAT